MPEVTTYYLEMCCPSHLKAKPPLDNLDIKECKIKQFQFNRFLYGLVGHAWQWTDKLDWSDTQWEAYVNDAGLRTWVAYTQGTPAGYYELQCGDQGSVQITYFGLASGFIGLGYGGYLLSHAIQSAWKTPGTQRVWVHTCSLDHPSALQNYQARGMKIYKELVSKR